MAHVQSWPDFSAMPTARTVNRKHAGSLKMTNFAVYEDIARDLYDIRKSQMSKLKAANKGF